jgi:hypothetical protein
VLPVALMSYWSFKAKVGKAGLNHLCTRIFSDNQERIGVTEMGLNSWRLEPEE